MLLVNNADWWKVKGWKWCWMKKHIEPFCIKHMIIVHALSSSDLQEKDLQQCQCLNILAAQKRSMWSKCNISFPILSNQISIFSYSDTCCVCSNNE